MSTIVSPSLSSANKEDQQRGDLTQSPKPRKGDAAYRLAFRYDCQKAGLLSGLAKQFHQPEKFQLFFLNLVWGIVNRLSVVYSEPPTRTVINGMLRDEEIVSVLWQKSFIDVKL